jgi:hypothetical protein
MAHSALPYRQPYLCQECGGQWFRAEWLPGGVLMFYCGEAWCGYFIGSIDQQMRRGL